jgi:hypothetical protein
MTRADVARFTRGVVPAADRARTLSDAAGPAPDGAQGRPGPRDDRNPAGVRGAAPRRGRRAGRGSGRRSARDRVRHQEAAFLARYWSHAEYGNRSAAGRVAAELAPLAGLQAGTGRTYIAEELRKLTNLTARRDLDEEDDDQPAG